MHAAETCAAPTSRVGAQARRQPHCACGRAAVRPSRAASALQMAHSARSPRDLPRPSSGSPTSARRGSQCSCPAQARSCRRGQVACWSCGGASRPSLSRRCAARAVPDAQPARESTGGRSARRTRTATRPAPWTCPSHPIEYVCDGRPRIESRNVALGIDASTRWNKRECRRAEEVVKNAGAHATLVSDLSTRGCAPMYVTRASMCPSHVVTHVAIERPAAASYGPTWTSSCAAFRPTPRCAGR